jgi:PAS domain-containing protein
MSGEWDQIEIWGSRFGAIMVIFTVLYAVYRQIKKSITKVLNIANRVQYISDQLESNGGTSLRDTINRIESRQIQTEQRERAFLQTHPNMMFELDVNLNLIWANRMFLSTLAVDSESVMQYGWHNIISEKDRERVIEQFDSAKQSARNMTTVSCFVVGNGAKCSFEASIIATVMRDSQENSSGFLVTINPTKKV